LCHNDGFYIHKKININLSVSVALIKINADSSYLIVIFFSGEVEVVSCCSYNAGILLCCAEWYVAQHSGGNRLAGAIVPPVEDSVSWHDAI